MSRADLTRFNLIAAGCAVAPLVLVSAVPSLLGSGPRRSMGASGVGVEAAVPATSKPTPRQFEALERVRALQGFTIGASPFRPAPPPTEAPETDPEPVAAPAAPTRLAPPEIVLRGVMRQADGTTRALIDGKLRAVGDQVAPGWTVERIDAPSRSITLTSTDGQTHTIGPR